MILLLATWLVLFQGAADGGVAAAVLSLSLLVLLHAPGTPLIFGFLCGGLTALLMAYQPSTATGLSQAAIASAWLLFGCFWAGRHRLRFVHAALLFGAVVLVALLTAYGVVALQEELKIRNGSERFLLALLAAFWCFPVAWWLGSVALNQRLLKQAFKWPASFILVALTCYAVVALAGTLAQPMVPETPDAARMERAHRLTKQLGHQSGLAATLELKESALQNGDWERAQALYRSGFWRRWSGVDRYNLNIDDAFVLWGETPWRLKSVMRQLCQGASRMAPAPLARKMLPLLAGDETRWACMAYQAISLDDEPMLEAMAEEMTHDNLPGRGIHLAGCRLQPVGDFPAQVHAGKWVDYEIKMSPWLNTASAELCPQAGQVELYIWGSFAKDVLPFSWFDNEARQAFRRWEIPEYIRPGRYPVYANVRMEPLWRRVRAVGIHAGRKGLFLGWTLVPPSKPDAVYYWSGFRTEESSEDSEANLVEGREMTHGIIVFEQRRA